jgi:hypothetical protein
MLTARFIDQPSSLTTGEIPRDRPTPRHLTANAPLPTRRDADRGTTRLRHNPRRPFVGLTCGVPWISEGIHYEVRSPRAGSML